MKKNKLNIASMAMLALALMASFVMTSCDLNADAESIMVEGTWEIYSTTYGPYTEEWIFTDTTIEYRAGSSDDAMTTNYKAEIISFDNNGLNGGDAEIIKGGTSTDAGYAVIKFTEVSGASWGTVDKYQIFRWGATTGDTSKRDFTQGSKDSNLDGDDNPWTNYVNEVFDSPAAAEAGATNDSGHFNGCSSGAVKQ